jgi:hypothetical protein
MSTSPCEVGHYWKEDQMRNKAGNTISGFQQYFKSILPIYSLLELALGYCNCSICQILFVNLSQPLVTYQYLINFFISMNETTRTASSFLNHRDPIPRLEPTL